MLLSEVMPHGFDGSLLAAYDRLPVQHGKNRPPDAAKS